MKTRLSALVTAVALGAAALTPALAFDGRIEGQARYMGLMPSDAEAPVILMDETGPNPFGCPMNSAAEGNANQQTRPVPQYGQTSGGSAC
ncbi:hypothetical protein PMNALOAF_0358 [Methylobacterium adhaesivum]|uniref:Uncharacterized protein n=1 Tax=Methylobacterium adhaesivum TaxID=333297 RepID=A0ABT8BFM8_9HYPH|nr:hypothetical protein [Methylobacterium adhaesivum]MDN3590061.1 hypothetical protein [Methylobacterium adhaesivum]GJD29126.1 hypothetical protein PMNALOAF_0358 [Methylobacterium adhaesivum]